MNSSPHYELNFTIPQGPTGPTGAMGPTGATGTVSSAYGRFLLSTEKSYDMVRYGSQIIELNSGNFLNNIEFDNNDNLVTIKEAGTYIVLFKVPVSLTSGNSVIISVGVNNYGSLYTEKTISQTEGTVYFEGFGMEYFTTDSRLGLYLQTSAASTVKVGGAAKLIIIKL